MKALLALLFLAGCATNDGYWIKTHDPVPVRGVIETATPGGQAYRTGYARRATGMIEIKPNLRSVFRECVVNHEIKHLAGYSHDPRVGFAVDCGDGTIVSP